MERHSVRKRERERERDRERERIRWNEKNTHIFPTCTTWAAAADMTADDRVFGVAAGGEERERLVYTGV